MNQALVELLRQSRKWNTKMPATINLTFVITINNTTNYHYYTYAGILD